MTADRLPLFRSLAGRLALAMFAFLLAPLIVVAAAVRLLFRALKPRKRRKSPVIDRLRARFA